jgi:hypothetical protein
MIISIYKWAMSSTISLKMIMHILDHLAEDDYKHETVNGI